MNRTGAEVEDVQQRLVSLGLLSADQADGVYGPDTARAVGAFRVREGLPAGDDVTEKVWAALVDATYRLGDRTLYLRVPHFHGNDVLELQRALGALGFPCGSDDGIFGAHTEDALRTFQLNMGLPSDGIAGSYTFSAIRNLHHSWEGKSTVAHPVSLGFARAAGVLESESLCLFGTSAFTRSVASRMSNLALATNPSSRIVSAESLSVSPATDMTLVHIVVPGEASPQDAPRVAYIEDDTLPRRLKSALAAARSSSLSRIAIELPGCTWEEAGEARSAQHFAITLLDGLCAALS
ncbi:peptidoglycan-binding domain-containing protein [Berryella wangjianweii]|uniref:peptidoglycan-binding domain-containing protein n=1 Tax=Berryella wangjianweii TaxID=2734634 RepID=UPI0028F6F97D|nr:peptidoglycan-binding protein [Berryella wangjianweii]